MSDNLPAGVTDYDIDRSQGYDPRAEARAERERRADDDYERMRDDELRAWHVDVRREAARQQSNAVRGILGESRITRDNAAQTIQDRCDDAAYVLRSDAVSDEGKRDEVVALMAACLRVLDMLEDER